MKTTNERKENPEESTVPPMASPLAGRAQSLPASFLSPTLHLALRCSAFSWWATGRVATNFNFWLLRISLLEKGWFLSTESHVRPAVQFRVCMHFHLKGNSLAVSTVWTLNQTLPYGVVLLRAACALQFNGSPPPLPLGGAPVEQGSAVGAGARCSWPGREREGESEKVFFVPCNPLG